MKLDREKRSSTALQAARRGRYVNPHRLWIVGAALFLCILIALRWGADLWYLLRNEQALEAYISQLGWLGPVGLIAFNAVQIVVAPIPGYVVQIASGYLFGPFWGGVWASIGLLTGAMLSMALVRYFGRPLAARLVGAARLERWETLTHSDSVWTWLLIIIMPTGDLPYFVAGLSRVKFRTIFVLTLFIRVPTTFAAAAVGAGALTLAWWQFMILLVVMVGVLLLFVRYQDQMATLVDAQVAQRLTRSEHPVDS